MALSRCQIGDGDSIPRPTAPRYSDGQRRLRVASINNIVVDDTDAESVVAFARERRRDARRHVIRESRIERSSAIEPGTRRAGTRRRECDLGRACRSHQLAENARYPEARRNQAPNRRGPTHDMAKNVGESRIPVPRAARPSFFPKSRVLEASRLLSGSRRSTIFSGCFQFVNAEDESPTPREKFSGFATSSPNIQRSRTADSESDQTYTISPGWNIDKDDVQDLVHFGEEKNSLFRLLESSQLSMIEDVGDTCLVESNLTNYNDTGAPPHYLMLNKQNSFEHDESLGILTPDQMTDFTAALECSRTPSCENLTGSAASKLALTRASASTRPLADVEPAEEGCTERTPSPEELPLDPKPVEPISRSGAVPASFVTSVTSITSLEAGYQGDGENSRPASRGADPPSMAVPPVNLPAPCRQDPMTDSDFFTESDADAHEEIVRGDRKAQVIDGTLFCAPGERVCPSFTGEEMDSSGIYSDLDKLQAPGEPEASEENEDRTPDTGDTELSQRSQLSPIMANVIMDYLQTSPKTSDDTGSTKNDTKPSAAEVTVIEKVENNENVRPKSQGKADTVPLKKYKMPKRNVVSKIKAMIESSSKDDAEKEARRSQRSTRKGGRWDAVMNKIEAGKNEQRTRSARKEVKSRVSQTLNLSPSTRPASKKAGDANNNNNKDKRRMRTWQEMKSPTQETARSSVRSSMSDLSSGPNKDIPKRSPTSANPPRRFVANGHANHHPVRANSFDVKKNCIDVTVELEKSPPSARKPAITRRLATNASVKQKSSTSSIKDRESKEAHNTTYTVRSLEKRDQAAQTTVPYEALRAEQAERAAQALAVTVQYLAFELDAFATPKLKKDFEKLKVECENVKKERSAALSESDELRTRCISVEERLEAEREDHRKALDQLHDELETHKGKQVAALVETLKEERRKYDVRLEDVTREHRATIAKLRAEQINELSRKEEMRRSVVHDQGAALMAEIESLRSVLELKSQENTALRSELDSYRRDIEEKDALQMRLDMVEARCEDLKAQLQRKESFERQISHENEMLHESIHQVSKQNKRLSQRNEELQWKLRNKNDWVSVLANQLNPRLTRSTGSEQVEHTFTPDKNSPHSSSMMKFMVDKGASVSWTLEIDDLSKGMSDSFSTLPKVGRPSEGTTTVSRQGSLRLTSNRPVADTRARSKSVSTTCDSARAAVVEETAAAAAWSPSFSSTPVPRRRPRKDQSSPCSSSSSSSSTSSAAPTVNPAVAAAVAAAAAAAAADDCSAGGGQRPQEAGGEAMISEETSASSSEDESFTGSDIPRLGIQFAWGKPIK